jgi:hypothetical protein
MSKKKKDEKHNEYYYDLKRNYPFSYDLKMDCPPGLKFNKPYNLEEVSSNWKNAEFAEHLDTIAESITDLLKEKNAAYGNTALEPVNIFSKLGPVEAIKARLDDKLSRIANRGINDKTEDTVRDVVGYLLLLLMAIDNEAENPNQQKLDL